MWQIKKSGQPVKVKLISAENGEVEITNRYLFTNLSELSAEWFIQADDEVLQQGRLNLDIGPQQKDIVKIPFSNPELKEGVQYRLLICFRLKEKSLWADKGFEIAWEQIDLPYFKAAINSMQEVFPPVEVKESGNTLIISGKGFSYILDKASGSLISLQLHGKELLKKVNYLNIWRAPLANETDEWNFGSSNIKHVIEGYGHFAATEWYSSGIDRLTRFPGKFTWERTHEGLLKISVRSTFITANTTGAFLTDYKYIIDGNGKIVIEASILPNGQMPAWLPRIGQEWVLDKTLDQVQWYGRGPQENYPDRKSGYRIGVYKSTVGEMYEPYLIPQDYGLRTDNRWVRMTDTDGTGLEFSGNKLFNFSAHPYSTENLTKALYTYQLQPFDGITFNLDYATSGVGCTADGVFPEYQVLPQRYDFTVMITPIKP